ncbi:outer membrane protein assembly factor BamB [Tahibacter amnicola]|uniref:Outer membrane protein assembly factor BamB n=1 Tax=Tahibacter amnicola TaxID=2976241 RepID=A0ABY6B9B6_9GAMM|nr:outer membrane protein assembly factor BamB [Tahibacter amnicola]UXI66604.1 outer membrane protein assembly factor BamB [Tahibacter amnicola]
MKKAALILPFAISVGLLGGCDWMKDRSTKKENIAAPKELRELTPTLSVTELWTKGTGKGAGKSGVRIRPAVADGKLYAAGVDGEITAIDAASGRTLWNEDFKLRFTGGPGVSGDLLVIGGLDGDVLALDASTGKERWRARVSAEVITAPAIGDGLAVVRCNDGRIYAFDVADGKQRWIYDRPTVPLLSLRGNSAPVINNGLVLSGTDAGKVVALRLSDGAPVWEQALAASEGRSEVERLSDADGTLAVESDVVFGVANHGQVVALGAANGRPLWNRPLSSYTNVDVSASQVYAVDEESQVWALDRTSGSSMWKQDAFQHRWLSGPAVQGGYVVVGDLEGFVHWLAIADGTEVARERLSKDPIRATPVVSGDVVYVEDVEGKLGAYRAQL